MFRNLKAEQARFGLTDDEMAIKLNIKRETYARKKQTQNFKLSEIKAMCNLFNCDFEYLFATESTQTQISQH